MFVPPYPPRPEPETHSMHLLYLLLLQIMGGYQQHVFFNIEPVITSKLLPPRSLSCSLSYPHTLDLNIDAVNGEP